MGYDPKQDMFHYSLAFNDMFGNTTEINGFSKTVNHPGNFYKSVLEVVEEVERKFFILPRLNMLPDRITRKGRGYVNGRSNKTALTVSEQISHDLR